MAIFIGRRYGDFNRLHKRLRTELPGKILPPMPRKNRQSSTASNLMSGVIRGDDDASSLSSVSTMGAFGVEPSMKSLTVQGKKTITYTKTSVVLMLFCKDHRKSGSGASIGGPSPRSSFDALRSRGAGTPKPESEVRDRC